MDRPDQAQPPDDTPGVDAVLVALEAEFAAEVDVAGITAEEAIAARRLAAIAAGRRKGGLAGAAMAGAMWTLQEIYIGPVRDDTPVAVAESPGEPGDIDTDGIEVTIGDVDVWAPPPNPPAHDPPGA